MKDLPKTSVTTINTELLERLYTINAPSQNTSAMNEFIHKWVIANIEDCIVEDDEYGNLYITKGTSDLYPCIVAHLDEVHNVEDRITLTINNDIYGFDVVKKAMWYRRRRQERYLHRLRSTISIRRSKGSFLYRRRDRMRRKWLVRYVIL